jgi:hypothetical protein
MATDFFVIVLLVATLAALVFLWLKLREISRKLEQSVKGLAEVERVVQGECLPAVSEGSRRLATVLDRLEAERASAGRDVEQSRASLAPLLGELREAARELGQARVELARLVERAGAKPAEDAVRAADGAWMKELVRTHLLGLGIGSVSIDGVAAKPDGSHVVRARGMRGDELWSGSVVVRAGKVESASSFAARMFP